MDLNRIAGSWRQTRNRARARWDRLTNDDLDLIDGRVEVLLIGLLQRYGMGREEAELSIQDWMAMTHDQV